jgi:hypothetical protein
MRIVVRDPWGFDHRLEHDGRRWWGCENLAHGAGSGRDTVIGKVMHAVAGGRPLPAGYRKVVRVSGQRFPDRSGAAEAESQLAIEGRVPGGGLDRSARAVHCRLRSVFGCTARDYGAGPRRGGQH